MQLTAAGGQSQQLSKALMKDYHDFMNEDSGIMFKKQVKEKKNPTNQTPQHKIPSAQQLQVANNTLLTKTTVSQDMNILASSDVYSKRSQPNPGSGNKESIGLLVCENKTEWQSWAFPNADLTSWIMVYFGLQFPCL